MAEIHPLEARPNGTAPAAATTLSETLGSKRQRRPSVRLGEIGGDHLYDAATHPRRATSGNKQLKAHHSNHQSHHLSDSDYKKDGNSKATSSRIRALTNLATERETLEEKELNLDMVAIGSWKVKDCKRRVVPPNATVRRARSNWGKDSKLDDGGGGGDGLNVMGGEDKYSGGEDMDAEQEEEEDDGYNGRGFNVENSESPLEEDNVNSSPVHSPENLGDGNERYEKGLYYDGRKVGTSRHFINQSHHLDGVDLSGPSDNDARDYGNNNVGCIGGGGGEDGVRIWLNSIGLGRYAPVFEIHEVDDEVLPLLTLEDLKDMGISAVGSRRKMFCAIQKLGRGFS